VVKKAVFAVPGDLATPTGGYAYDRRIIAELGARGWQVQTIDLGEGFPHPSPTQRSRALARLEEQAPAVPIVIDGLAYGVLPEVGAALHASHRLVALVHHPLAFETGLTPAAAAALHASERSALAHAHRVIATSAATARLLVAEFGVAEKRLTVAQPGTDRAVPARRERASGPVSLLAVGSVVPRKGYDVLVAALAHLRDLPWRLVIAGDRERSADTTRLIDAEIARLDLADRISFAGVVASERMGTLYQAADVFVLASHFEGYGMAYAEAIAHGLPVVGSKAGAVPDTVPACAGVLLMPGDVDALAATLRRLVENSEERERLAAGARAAAATLPTWSGSAKLFAQALEALS
jgi:glycosyltransferase involved in cell wall biosynthesis